MFAHDWPEEDEHDDHLPLEERGWVRRIRGREAARKRFNRKFPHCFERIGRALVENMQEVAVKIMLAEKET